MLRHREFDAADVHPGVAVDELIALDHVAGAVLAADSGHLGGQVAVGAADLLIADDIAQAGHTRQGAALAEQGFVYIGYFLVPSYMLKL